MPQNEPRVIIVTFDAASKGFALNPDPIRIPEGSQDLYFALQTANRGDANKAGFTSIFEDHQFATATAVDGSNDLWKVAVVNDPAPTSETAYSYTVSVSYAGSVLAHDPTVILEPPPIGP